MSPIIIIILVALAAVFVLLLILYIQRQRDSLFMAQHSGAATDALVEKHLTSTDICDII